MFEESKHAHDRLAEWTRRKDEWRRERAAGGGPSILKPQRNDRPEVAERAARSCDAPR